MKRLIIICLIALSSGNHIIAQSKYDNELKLFLHDVLSDDYQYTYKNYIEDSIKLSKETFVLPIQYYFLKSKIDTLHSKVMIRTNEGKMHFDSLVIVAEPTAFYYEDEIKKILNYLSKDTIFEIANPYSKRTLNKSIRLYRTQKKKVDFRNYIKSNFVSNQELESLINQGKDWAEFYKKYGSGYLSMTTPIFTTDYEYAYFDWSYNCGRVCGYGYSSLYKKTNGKWLPIKIYMAWMS